MAVEVRIIGGARAGARERFEKSVITVGRHPMNDLRFDADKDLDVSSRHAEIRSVEGRHILRDLGSTNGTFVNGEKIVGERELADGDTVLFGAGGPKATLHFVEAAPAATVQRPSGAGVAGGAPVGATPPRRPTEVRIAEAVREQTGVLRQMVIGLAALVVVGGVGSVWWTQRSNARMRQQVDALLQANDSLSTDLERRLAQTGLADSALKVARDEARLLGDSLRSRQSSGGDIAQLSAQMRAAQSRTASLARMDYAAVTAANKGAIVFLVVEMPDSARATGTGFNILPSGLIVTNRHVVQAPDGTRAQRIAVAFDGTRGAWLQATIESVSSSDEIAFLRLVHPGNFPTVSGVSRHAGGARLGEPVAILGYPLGTETVGMGRDIDRLTPTATLGFGTISKVLDETLQLDAYAAQGSSGSPVFNASGLVVGVIFGGAAESGGRIVYAVPSARLARELPTDAASILR